MNLPNPHLSGDNYQVYHGDCREILDNLPTDSVDCVVTSPPYWLHRRYSTEPQVWNAAPECDHSWVPQTFYNEAGVSGARGARKIQGGAANAQRIREGRWREFDQCHLCGAIRTELGQEKFVSWYVEHLREALDAVQRVLKPTGSLWLNLGDTYHNKRLVQVPARVAIALQDAGWTLRNEIVWRKPNGAPLGNCRDRLNATTERVLLLTKVGERSPYYFDHAYAKAHKLTDVWEISPATGGQHTAVMPRPLARRCINLGCPPGGTVLDPFAGEGTTLAVACSTGRKAIEIELNPDYVGAIAKQVRDYDAAIAGV